MPDILEPPGAPPAAPVAPATPTIRVSQMPSPAAPAAPVKPGSAKDRLFESLRSKATIPGSPPAVPPAAAPTPAAPAAPPAAAAPGEPPATPATPAAPAASPATPDPGKKNPWRIVDDYKARLTKTEADLAEARKNLIPEPQRKAELDRLKAIEDRNKELETEIRYVNYQKSAEFQEKYQQPYEAAWKRAMHELSEVTVIADEVTGQRRPATAQDLLTLMNMPLGEAQAQAETMFGNLASYVMGHRSALRTLFDQQAEQLEKVRKEGGEREAQVRTQTQQQLEKMQTDIKTTWAKASEESINDPTYGKYFKPIDGDQDGNQRLAKGFQMVDEAFSTNPMDPRLTPEQREQVVRKHNAVRNRAAATGRIIAWNRALEAENAELKERLKQFQGSVPPSAPSAGNGSPAAGHHSAWDGVRAGLQKIAK